MKNYLYLFLFAILLVLPTTNGFAEGTTESATKAAAPRSKVEVVEVYIPFFVENRYQGDTATYIRSDIDLFTAAPAAPVEITTYKVKAGDTLVIISKKIFGDPSSWMKIYNMNSDQLSDPNVIIKGTVLKVKVKAKQPKKPLVPVYTIVKRASMAAPSALKYLGDWAHPGVMTQLKPKVKASPNGELLSFNALRAAGLKVELRKETLEIHVFIPPRLRKTVIHHFGITKPEITGERLFVPNKFSAHMNLYGTQDLQFNVDDKDFNAPSANLAMDTAINVKGYVLEGTNSYNGGDEPSFQRQDTRMVKDFPDIMLRTSLGDLVYPVTQFQNYRTLGGISVTRNFDLKPYKIVVPSSHRDFFLKSPAIVTIIQNGVRLQSIELSSGYHRLQNLPISPGINLIVLEIRDQAGRIEYINVTVSTNGELLKGGLHQFTYNAGYPSSPKNGDKNYDGTNPTFSAFHRYGITDELTVGSSLQKNSAQTIGALEYLMAVGIGTLGGEVVASRTANHPTDGAQRITYTYDDYRKENETFRIGFLSVEHRGESFTLLENLPPDRLLEYQVLASYGQSIFWGLNASVSFSHNFNRKITPDTRDSNQTILSVSKSWKNGFSFSANGIHTVTDQGITNNEALILLTWNLSDGKQSIDFLSDSAQKTNRVDWRYSESGQVNRWQARAGTGKVDQDAVADFDVNYIGNRGIIGVTHNVLVPDSGATTQESQFRASTGIAYTAGRVAMGPPIADSFAIVTKPTHWLDQSFEVNPTIAGTYDTQVNGFGPGVVANITSYQYYPLYFDNTQVAEGYFFDPTSYTVLSSYKSGFLIEPGTDASVVLRGRLINSKDEPIALFAGTIKNMETGEEVDFFTNRSGVFLAEGLKEGKFEFISNLGEYDSKEFKIPKGKRGSLQLGNIVLPISE